VLEPFGDSVRIFETMIGACIDQARADGAGIVHKSLQGLPGVDSEMLDQAAEYATRGGA